MSGAAMVVLTTVDSEALAETLATRLLEQRLAACVQAVPIASRYRWQGAVRCDDEILLLIKTSRDAVAATMRCIETHHSYEVPEILALPVADGLPAYLDWIARETAGPHRA